MSNFQISALEVRNQSLVEELKRLRLPIDALERFEERMKTMASVVQHARIF